MRLRSNIILAFNCILLIAPIQSLAQVKKLEKSPQQHKAHFKSLGSLSPSSAVAHVFTRADANQAIRAANRLTDEIDGLQREAMDDSREWAMWANATFYQMNSRMETMKTDLRLLCLHLSCKVKLRDSVMMTKRLTDTPPDMSFSDFFRQEARKERFPNKRVKKFAEIVSLFGLGLSVYDFEQISELKNELFHLDNQVNHISQAIDLVEAEKFAINSNSKQIMALRSQVELLRNRTNLADYEMVSVITREYVNDFITNLERYVHGLKDILIHQRLDTRFFTFGQMSHALENIKEKAQRAGWNTLHSEVSEVLGDKVSFMANEGVVFIFVHITLIQPTLHQLYEFVEAPLPFKGGLVQPRLPSKIFSINADNTEMTILTHDELNSCLVHHHRHVCRGLTIIKSPRSHCIGALYLGSPEEMVHYCNFDRLETNKEIIVRSGETTILTYIPPGHTVSATITCLSSDQRSTVPSSNTLLVGNEQLTLPYACTLSTDEYIVKIPHKRDIVERFIMRPLEQFEDSLFKYTHMLPVPNVLPSDFKPYNFPKLSPPREVPKNPTNHFVLWGILVIVCIALLVSLRPLRRPVHGLLQQLLLLLPCKRDRNRRQHDGDHDDNATQQRHSPRTRRGGECVSGTDSGGLATSSGHLLGLPAQAIEHPGLESPPGYVDVEMALPSHQGSPLTGEAQGRRTRTRGASATGSPSRVSSTTSLAQVSSTGLRAGVLGVLTTIPPRLDAPSDGDLATPASASESPHHDTQERRPVRS